MVRREWVPEAAGLVRLTFDPQTGRGHAGLTIRVVNAIHSLYE